MGDGTHDVYEAEAEGFDPYDEARFLAENPAAGFSDPDSDEAERRRAMVRVIARGCVERMEALGVKGKRRDDEALSYWAGAWQSAKAMGDERLARYLGNFTATILAYRGFREVERLSVEPVTDA